MLEPMSARDHLFSLYEQWRRLSLAESEGIQRADWAEVTRCQNAKSALQARIIVATDALKEIGRASCRERVCAIV